MPTPPGFFELLISFLLSQGELGQKYPVVVFAAACSCLGLLTVVLDMCLYAMRGFSLFDFKYTPKSSFVILFGWSVGAAITGFFGNIFNVLQISLLASATAGIAWPVIAAKMIKDRTQGAAADSTDTDAGSDPKRLPQRE
jgi:hypothetical protein